MRWFRLLLLVAYPLILFVAACASNTGNSDRDGGTGMDGRTGGRDVGISKVDGRVVVADGALPDGGSVEPCGANGQNCCRGNACDLGLRCGTDMQCCSRPGGAPCAGAGDCCTGFVCERGECRTPEGGNCIGSSDCSDGLACLTGMCMTPTDGCGALNGNCCSGDVCRSGFACDTTANNCVTCGNAGQPCCDGTASCGSSSALLCLGGSCEMPVGCGTAGMPCCAPDDACVRGTTCESGMCMMDPAPGSEGSDCGGDGQSCCSGGVCGLGSVCESFITNRCIGIGTVIEVLGIDCGEDGEICCLPDFTCEGDLNCDFLFCSGGCDGLSNSCTSKDECCDTALCKPSPSTLRCCRGQGGACGGSLDCCGYMLCEDGTCACQEVDESCVDDADCCNMGECILGVCKPMGSCFETRESCMDDSQCCGALSCGAVIEVADGMQSEMDQCCAGAEASCKENADCCGAMECQGGECRCQAETNNCADDDECCGDLICVLGECATNDGSCGRVGDSCSGGDCCGTARCRNIGSATGPEQCCGRDTDRCERNDDCCGTMQCNAMTKSCECKAIGETCINGDCCGAAICTDGTCS